jgi:CheY-like chemotaxis protein
MRRSPHPSGNRVLEASNAAEAIALATSQVPDIVSRFIAAGFDGYLEKPVNIRTLALDVRAYFR